MSQFIELSGLADVDPSDLVHSLPLLLLCAKPCA
jgi:hypothetical protein